MENIYLTWLEFKPLFISKELPIQFIETAEKYTVFFFDEGTKFYTEIWIDTTKVAGLNVTQNNLDRTDFETNFKNTANLKPLRLTNDTIPARAQRVENRYISSISGSTDSVYVIPNGKTLVLQRFKAGTSLSLGTIVSTRVEILHDPNGDGSLLIPIDTAFLSINHIDVLMNKEIVGNGVAAIRTRRRSLDLGAREVFVQWEGYLK